MKIVLAAAVALTASAVLVSPALAKKKYRHARHVVPAVAMSAQAGYYGTPVGPIYRNPNTFNPSPNFGRPDDPYGVYWNDNTFIGRDPDPNIRRSLYQEWFEMHEKH